MPTQMNLICSEPVVLVKSDNVTHRDETKPLIYSHELHLFNAQALKMNFCRHSAR